MTSTQRLLDRIEAFIEANSMSATTFGEMAVGDRHLLRRLRSGKSVTLPTADQIEAFIESYKPLRARRPRSGNAVAVA